MRIAFAPAARLLSDRRPNGEALIAVELLRRLAARGHTIVAYCETAELDPIDGVDVRATSAEGRTAAMSRINFARRIARDAARERFDVVHHLFPMNTHTGYSFVRGAPLVCGPLNLPWPETVAPPKRAVAHAAAAVFDRVEHRLHLRTIERSARLLVTGRTSRDAIPERFHTRCVEVPFGIDIDRFRPDALPDGNRILFHSVLQPRKGAEILVRAMPWILARCPSARVVIAGEDPGDERARLERLATELGVGEAVAFGGPIAPADAPSVYGGARVFCQPSLGEPFGMTVLEAMASGRPVVGTAAGGVPDLVVDGRGGRLVPAGDERLLADALVSLLARPETAVEMGAFNRQRAERRFAIERIVDRIELTYEAIVAGGTASRTVAEESPVGA